MSDNKRLIFCDSVAACRKFLAHGQRSGQYIAMNPDVFAYLKEKGFPVVNTLPYFSTSSHERLLKKSNKLTNWLRDNLEFADLGLGIEAAYRDIFMFWMRFALHYCLWSIEIISNAVEKHQPESLIVVSENKPVSSRCIEPEEGILSEFVRLLCKKRSLSFEDHCLKAKPAATSSVKRFCSFIYKIVRSRLANMARRSERPIVFTTTLYHMDKIAKQFPEKDVRFLNNYFVPLFKAPAFLFGKNRRAVGQQRKLVDTLCSKIVSARELFAFRGIEFGSILARKISKDYVDIILNAMLDSLLLDQELDRLDPAVVVSNVSRFDDIIVAELCRQKQIPSLLVSHGSHVKPKNEHEMIEWGEHGRLFLSAPFSHIAVPTPISNDYFEAFPTQATTIKVKPPTWGAPVNKQAGQALFKQMFNDRYQPAKTRVVVHAGTPKASNTLRLYVYETVDEYIQALRELAAAVEQLPDTVLVIKFRPLREISVETLKRLVPFSDKVKLSVTEPLLDVLAMADLLVSFSSTAVDEALQNRIPVLLYGGFGRYQHVAAHQLRGRADIPAKAIYHLAENALPHVIKKIIELHQNGAQARLFDQYIHPESEVQALDALVKEMTRK